jgi:methionine-gamma-lyase
MAKGYRRTLLDGQALHPQTQMTAFGYDPALSEGAVKPPVFLTSTFVFESAEQGAEFFDIVAGRKAAPTGAGVGGLVYSRFNHPNLEIVEDRLALYDHAESALVTSSGMAAISAVALSYLRPGDAIVHYTPLYGGTETLIGKVLTQWGIRPFPFADGTSAQALMDVLVRAAQDGPVKMVYLETPANPTNALTDLAMVRDTVDTWSRTSGQQPIIVCDNTMLGPVFQQPLDFGVDVCVYSLTKYVGGHSDLVAGAVTGSREMLRPVRQTRSAYGFQLDPHSSWMLSRSMETLSLRMERAAESGRKVAAWLAANPHIPCRVLHPEHARSDRDRAIYARQCSGPGSTFSFVLSDDRSLAFRVLNNLEIFKLAVSLGGTESLVCHPASTTHSGVPAETRASSGVTEGLIRLSVGLEHPDDLIRDLDQAFRRAVRASTSNDSPARAPLPGPDGSVVPGGQRVRSRGRVKSG